jgi:hypothetical protein
MAGKTEKKPLWKTVIKWVLGSIIGLSLALFLLVIWFHNKLFSPENVEKARGAEAWQILYQMSQACGAYFSEDGNTSRCTPKNLININYPSICDKSYYFRYSVQDIGGSKAVFRAVRCAEGGKGPQGKSEHYLNLTVDYKCQDSPECRKLDSNIY